MCDPFNRGDKVIDVETGGGLPGLPLAILFPSASFTLLDINSKKIMSGSKQLYGQGQHRQGQAAVQVDESYDVRAEVERLLVNRQYVLKVGDLGHCCQW